MIVCAEHLGLKYKIASKEYDYDMKTWHDDTRDVEYDGNIYRDVYIVPILDANCCCNKCDILGLLTPSRTKSVLKLADGNKDVTKYKETRKEIAKKNKILDAEKVHRMRALSRGNRNRLRFASLFEDEQGIFNAQSLFLPCRCLLQVRLFFIIQIRMVVNQQFYMMVNIH